MSAPLYGSPLIEPETPPPATRFLKYWGVGLIVLGGYFLLSGAVGLFRTSLDISSFARVVVAVQVLLFGATALGSGLSLRRGSATSRIWLSCLIGVGILCFAIATARDHLGGGLVLGGFAALLALPPLMALRGGISGVEPEIDGSPRAEFDRNTPERAVAPERAHAEGES